MSPREIQARLKQLIMDLETLEPGLANRLRNIWKSLRSIKPGQLMRAEYSPLKCFLTEVILDAEVWRDLLMLASEEDQKLFIESLTPTQRYWYTHILHQEMLISIPCSWSRGCNRRRSVNNTHTTN